MKRIAIVGMGTMGSAIGELLKDRFAVIEVRRGDNMGAVANADIIVLAVKPQQFFGLADDLREHVGSQTIVSIMAGVRVDTLASGLGATRIVRTMPNLALQTGQSLTAWYTVDDVIDSASVREILDCWGKSLRLENEAQFDAFTALAGSGPAYFFELARVLEVAARQHGFNDEHARLIATQTLLGAASIVGLKTDFAAQVQRVASKGGTTQAALGVFFQVGFADTIHQAVNAAAARSRELGRQL